MAGIEAAEVADGVYRLALPLGIHGVPTVSAYLLRGDDGDTLVDVAVSRLGWLAVIPGRTGRRPSAPRWPPSEARSSVWNDLS